MPKKLTLADVERTVRRMAPEWWDSLTTKERLKLVDQYNESRAEQDLKAQRVHGASRKARRT